MLNQNEIFFVLWDLLVVLFVVIESLTLELRLAWDGLCSPV